ncbi:MAG: PilW family protein [Piscinibacter sp.]|nr:PilW family protein [Piscinibacter sp.]
MTTWTLPQRRVLRRQAGFTLVELLVAMALGLIVVGATVAALIIGRQGFTAVDSSSQLRENTRFAASLIQRIGVQAGFENSAKGDTNWKIFCRGGPSGCGDANGDTTPGVRAYDNAAITALPGAPGPLVMPTGLAHGTRDASCAVADTSCRNGSDILMVRYWGDNREGVAAGDGSMINCAGMNEPESAVPAYSIFHVVRSAAGEPTLACTYRDPTTFAWTTMPLVTGVEGFQLLFGVDNVAAGAAPPIGDTGTDSVPELYLRASQIDVPGDAAATADNWRRVRSIRVGLLVRGSVGSAIDANSSGGTFSVLGAGFGVAGDVGSNLVAANDRRLRHTQVFTIHLRNPQFVVPANWNP